MKLAARTGLCFLVLVSGLRAQRAGAQTTIDDVRAARRLLAEDIADIQYTWQRRNDQFTEVCRLWLIGRPMWSAWKCESRITFVSGKSRTSAHAFDGELYRILQGDGRGAVLPASHGKRAYRAFGPIWLTTAGLSPESWTRALFASPTAYVEDVPESPGIVRLRTRDIPVELELDALRGFVPLRETWRNPDGSYLSDRILEDYRQVDGFWIPHRLVDRLNGQVEEVRDVRVNQGLRAEDMRVSFPFGTNISYPNDVTRVAGDSGLAEAEEALQVWFAHLGQFRRSSAYTTATEAAATLRRSSRLAAMIPAINVCLGLALAASGLLLARRRSAAAAPLILLLGLTPRCTAATAQETTENSLAGSAAAVTYLTLSVYDREVSLADLLESLPAARDASAFEAIAARLAQAGLQALPVRLSIDELKTWRYPAILVLTGPGGADQTRLAVLLASDGDLFTLADPWQLGRLDPWTRDRLGAAWTGQALLTAPVPIRVSDPWLAGVYASFAAPAAGLLFALVRVRRVLRPLGTGACGSVILLALQLVGGCGRPAGGPDPPVGETVRLDSTEWSAGSCYAETVRRTFQLTNRGQAPVKITAIKPSCGCMLLDAPLGAEVAAGQTLTFTLSVDLRRARGPVQYTLRLELSNGQAHTIHFSASVHHGVYAEPDAVRVVSATPGERIESRIRLIGDDERPFEILSAVLPAAERVEIDAQRKIVSVTIANLNRVPAVQDVLRVSTTHPRAPTLELPVFAQFERTWEIRPSGLYLRGVGPGEAVDKIVRIRSRTGTPFVVSAAQSDAFEAVPATSEASPEQEVRIRLRKPSGRPALLRLTISLPTSLPDAPLVDLPVVFYD